MSLGTGRPYCWLCKNFEHQNQCCNLHKIYVPIAKGYTICKDFSDIKYEDYAQKNEWFLNFRKQKLLDNKTLYVYSENSSFEEYISFDELRLKGR